MPLTTVHAVGIDISDGSLELANVHERRDGMPVLTEHGRVVLPDHVIVHGHIQDPKLLTEAFYELLERTSIDTLTAICTALPDSQVLTKIIPLPHSGALLSYETLQQSVIKIYRTLGYHIKDPVLQWKYRQLPESTEGELRLFVIKKETALQWQRFFKHVGMRCVVLEMESLALERALIRTSHAKETIAIIDFGFRMTMVSIFDATGLRFTHTIERGGFDLTNDIMRALHCSNSDAEQLKVRVGLTSSGSKAVQKVLKDATTSLLSHIKASLTEYADPIRSVLITGGGARLRGIRTATEHSLKIPTQRGIPWLTQEHATKGHLASSRIDPSHTLYYTGALGLAVRGMNRYTLAKGINFLE